MESPSIASRTDPIRVLFEQLMAGLARVETRIDDYVRRQSSRHTLRSDPEPPHSRAQSRPLEVPLPFTQSPVSGWVHNAAVVMGPIAHIEREDLALGVFAVDVVVTAPAASLDQRGQRQPVPPPIADAMSDSLILDAQFEYSCDDPKDFDCVSNRGMVEGEHCDIPESGLVSTGSILATEATKFIDREAAYSHKGNVSNQAIVVTSNISGEEGKLFDDEPPQPGSWVGPNMRVDGAARRGHYEADGVTPDTRR
ncbi:hypothetical protein SASPL_154345 [Salvia splendens]|uniref:Uncharacterized protein n=1 Tax=Salvia splendens TaxID=180675 RepID=A0A8X8W073_SALSN|nr:hypothetical protein SASPL_154345 [Salvia splendens]